MVERSLSMREVPGSIPGFSNFFFLPKLLSFFFLLFLANSSDDKQVFRCKLLTILFKFLASRPSLCLCRTCWGMRSPTNVVSGTGTRDEPLRTSALEARASAKIADFRSTEMSNVHLAGFSKTLPPNLQSCRDNLAAKLQRNLDLTKCQGNGEICSLYRCFVIAKTLI